MRRMSSSWSMMSPWSWIAGLLSIIGALNWGFVGLFNFNLVRSIFGPMSWLSRFIYTMVGISGLYMLFSYWSMRGESQPGWRRWFQ